MWVEDPGSKSGLAGLHLRGLEHIHLSLGALRKHFVSSGKIEFALNYLMAFVETKGVFTLIVNDQL
jgi:hypothetical protein